MIVFGEGMAPRVLSYIESTVDKNTESGGRLVAWIRATDHGRFGSIGIEAMQAGLKDLENRDLELNAPDDAHAEADETLDFPFRRIRVHVRHPV